MPFLFQRIDLPLARTGGLPPIGGSPSLGARIFSKKNRAYGETGNGGTVSYTHLTLPTIYSV